MVENKHREMRFRRRWLKKRPEQIKIEIIKLEKLLKKFYVQKHEIT